MEAVMTDQRELQPEGATDQGPEVRPEVIQDLDVTDYDADDVLAGRARPFSNPDQCRSAGCRPTE
jgi:hypothetical protein